MVKVSVIFYFMCLRVLSRTKRHPLPWILTQGAFVKHRGPEFRHSGATTVRVSCVVFSGTVCVCGFFGSRLGSDILGFASPVPSLLLWS